MKKLGIVAVLLAVGVFTASGLFAQELKFDGYVNAGLGVVFSNQEGGVEDPFIAAVGNDSFSNAWNIRLNAAYTNEEGTIGANVRLQATNGYSYLNVPFGYGWFSVFDKILTVKAGIVDDGTWNTGGTILNGDTEEGLGTLVKVSPISGLDIGVGAYLTQNPLGSQDNGQTLETTNAYLGGRFYVRDFDEAKYSFHLGYTLPDLLKIVASFRTKSEVAVAGAAQVPSRMRAGVSLLAVPNLKANVELELDNLQDFKEMKFGDEDAWGRSVGQQPVDAVPGTGGNPGTPAIPAGPTVVAASGKINIFQTVQYDMGSLSVGVWAAEWLTMAEKNAYGKDTVLGFYANPYVSYALGSIVPRLDVGYGSGMRQNFNNNTVNWRRTFYTAEYDDDFSVIVIRPSVKFNLDARTFIEIGDLLGIENVNKAYGASAWKSTDDSRISNVFYIDFKWSF
jgi:hypothetical protein